MEQALPKTWTPRGLHSDPNAAAEPVASQTTTSRGVRAFFSARIESIAAGDPSGMPPVVQFAMHAIAWTRAKVKGATREVSPLRLVSQLPLGGKRSLSLVEADGLRFLVGGGADSVTIIVPVSRMQCSIQ